MVDPKITGVSLQKRVLSYFSNATLIFFIALSIVLSQKFILLLETPFKFVLFHTCRLGIEFFVVDECPEDTHRAVRETTFVVFG